MTRELTVNSFMINKLAIAVELLLKISNKKCKENLRIKKNEMEKCKSYGMKLNFYLKMRRNFMSNRKWC